MCKIYKEINARLFDKIILINMPEICIINMYVKIIKNSYWPFKERKYVVVQFRHISKAPKKDYNWSYCNILLLVLFLKSSKSFS